MRVGGGAEILDEQVRVRSEGDADVTVPHEALDAVRVHSAAEQLGCEGVAQVVEADGNVQGDGPEPPSAWIGEWRPRPSVTLRHVGQKRGSASLGRSLWAHMRAASHACAGEDQHIVQVLPASITPTR